MEWAIKSEPVLAGLQQLMVQCSIEVDKNHLYSIVFLNKQYRKSQGANEDEDKACDYPQGMRAEQVIKMSAPTPRE